MLRRALALFATLTALALAGGSFPQGTQFALLDPSGNVLWTYTEGQTPSQTAPGPLAQAAILRIVLPDGTAVNLPVTVEGEGRGLGEVKLLVDGRLVPLPELLHAPGFTLKDGQLALSRGKSEQEGQKGKPEEAVASRREHLEDRTPSAKHQGARKEP